MPILEWFRFKMRCILWLLMFQGFYPLYALNWNLMKFMLSLMYLIFCVFINFKQIIFWILFPWVINQILVKLLRLNFGITFYYRLNFCGFRRFVIDLDITFCKLENFIIRLHIKICQKHLGFINDAIFLIFDFIYESLTLINNVFISLWLINKK